ncbi:uncharacterized protein [Rutidosis leptorrhynchoides]|uniref:uncharacterized protein n=1 Tax=Rutidosis leptorrhynchoides TaxID=125765 RepID=UPI003A9A40E2
MENFPSVSAYCQELKLIADQLSNVGEKVNNTRLVLQLIVGLLESYDSIVSQLAYLNLLPEFYEARSCVILEETRKQKLAMATSCSNSALVATTSAAQSKPTAAPTNNYSPRPPQNQGNHSNRGRSGG